MAKGLAAATLDPEYLARFRARPRARRGRLLAGVQAAAVGVYEGAVGARRRAHSGRQCWLFVGVKVNLLLCGHLQQAVDAESIGGVHRQALKLSDVRPSPTPRTATVLRSPHRSAGRCRGLSERLSGRAAGAGVVREPLAGWHERGAAGAALGAYVGLAGAVLKPMSGLLECLARTASGLSSAVHGWGEAPVGSRAVCTHTLRLPMSTLCIQPSAGTMQ